MPFDALTLKNKQMPIYRYDARDAHQNAQNQNQDVDHHQTQILLFEPRVCFFSLYRGRDHLVE